MDGNLVLFGVLIILVIFAIYYVRRDARKGSSRPKNRYYQSHYGSDQGATPDGSDFSDSSSPSHKSAPHGSGGHHGWDSGGGHH